MQENFYTIYDLAKDLGVFAKKMDFYTFVYQNLLGATYRSDEAVYQPFYQKGVENNTPFLLPDQASSEEKDVFVFKDGKTRATHLLVDKRGVLSFVSKYKEELDSFGVPKNRLSYILTNTPQTYVRPDKKFSLYSVAHMLTKNSKTAALLSDFILENFLTKTYETTDADGHKKTERFFVYYIPPRARSAFYFKKETLDLFLSLYQDELLKKAKEIEEISPFIPLRHLSCEVSGRPGFTKKLTTFIQEKALTDVYQVSDGNKKQNIKAFEYVNGFLSVHKQAVRPFVQKYQAELQKLGARLTDHIVLGVEKTHLPETDLSFSVVATQLGNHKLGKELCLFANALSDKEKKLFLGEATYLPITDKKEGKVKFIFARAILKDKIFDFVKTYQEALIKIGFLKKSVLHFIKKTTAPLKKENAITIRDLLVSLSINPLLHKKLKKDIHNFTDETYVPSNQTTPQPIFQAVKSRTQLIHVFTSKEAETAFLNRHQDLFLSYGINPLILEEKTGKRTILPMDESYMPLRDLRRLLHKAHLKYTPEMLAHKVTVTLEDGTTITEPLIFLVRKEKGHISYVIKKENILFFAKFYQKELGITNYSIAELEGKAQVKCKTKDLLSLYYFSVVIGHSSPEKRAALNAFIENECMEDTYTSAQNPTEAKAVFRRAFSPGQDKEVLYIDSNGAEGFLITRAPELQKMNIDLKKFHQKRQASRLSFTDYVLKAYKKAVRREKD